MQYVATFFSHYAAVLFSRRLAAEGIQGALMPVPRRVSSSCGTGVQFETEMDVSLLAQDGLDKIFRCDDGVTYTQVYETGET